MQLASVDHLQKARHSKQPKVRCMLPEAAVIKHFANDNSFQHCWHDLQAWLLSFGIAELVLTTQSSVMQAASAGDVDRAARLCTVFTHFCDYNIGLLGSTSQMVTSRLLQCDYACDYATKGWDDLEQRSLLPLHKIIWLCILSLSQVTMVAKACINYILFLTSSKMDV